MRMGQRSRTAEYMALFRALETQRPIEQRLFADPLAASFLTRPLAAAAAVAGLPVLGGLVPLLIDRQIPGPRASAVARTKVLDDAVTAAAVAGGIEQLIVLGAGYDSRAYRLPGTQRLRVFEVDHPDTQSVKRRVLEQVLGQLPAHVRFVPVDFDHDDLAAALDHAGLAHGRPSFELWEGVASYLTSEAVDATVRWASQIAGEGSELALTYVHRGLIEGTVVPARCALGPFRRCRRGAVRVRLRARRTPGLPDRPGMAARRGPLHHRSPDPSRPQPARRARLLPHRHGTVLGRRQPTRPFREPIGQWDTRQESEQP